MRGEHLELFQLHKEIKDKLEKLPAFCKEIYWVYLP